MSQRLPKAAVMVAQRQLNIAYLSSQDSEKQARCAGVEMDMNLGEVMVRG